MDPKRLNKRINVLVYVDEGTGELSTNQILKSLRSHLAGTYAVQEVVHHIFKNFSIDDY